MADSKEGVLIPWDSIVPTYNKETNPNKMTDKEFRALVGLMKTEGFLQNILVTSIKGKKGKYQLIDGHHRYWAAAELDHMPCFAKVITASEAKAVLLGIGLNRIRGDQDLSMTGELIRGVMEKTGWIAEQCANLTGISTEEIEAITQKANENAEDFLEELEGASGLDADDGEEIDLNQKPYVLEIQFKNKEQYQLARKRLRKAAGKGKDLAVGLLSLLGEEEDGE